MTIRPECWARALARGWSYLVLPGCGTALAGWAGLLSWASLGLLLLAWLSAWAVAAEAAGLELEERQSEWEADLWRASKGDESLRGLWVYDPHRNGRA